MSRFEKFAAEQDVMDRIEQLHKEGFEEADITVITSQKLESAYLKYKSVNFKNSEGTTWDKFVSMFSDDDPRDKVLGAFDITDSEKEHFKYALDRQEILLFKEGHAADDEKYAREEPREYHETQQQDTQAMEDEAQQNERLDARNTATGSLGRYSYEHDSDDDRFDSVYSSKASTRGAGGGTAGGLTYEEEADRAVKDAIAPDSERENVEFDNDITLKDTEDNNEYDYKYAGDEESNGTPVKNEYAYNSKEYDYKK